MELKHIQHIHNRKSEYSASASSPLMGDYLNIFSMITVCIQGKATGSFYVKENIILIAH